MKPKTMQEIIRDAEAGDAAAQLTLSLCYFTGDGVEANKQTGAEWCRKAAEQGHAPAQLALGVFHFNGDGVPKDMAEGAKWCRKAAEQGYAAAQFNLGACYELGTGVKKDKQEAIKWYTLAADQGEVHALYNLGKTYEDGDGVPVDKKRAEACYMLAGAKGGPQGHCRIEEARHRGHRPPGAPLNPSAPPASHPAGYISAGWSFMAGLWHPFTLNAPVDSEGFQNGGASPTSPRFSGAAIPAKHDCLPFHIDCKSQKGSRIIWYASQ